MYFLPFSRAKDVKLVVCNNTKENFLWEAEKMKVKFHKIASYTWNFTCVFTILVKYYIHFLGLLREIFFAVITYDQLHLQTVKKRMQYSLNYSGTRFLSTEN